MSANTKTVLSPAKLAHVVLRTTHFEPMVAFYKAILGAHIVLGNENMAFLTYDDEHHRLAIVKVPNEATNQVQSSGLDHISFTYNTLQDLLTAYKQRKALGILPVWNVHHGPTISMYYMDHDGTKIEMQVDVFENPADADAFISSPAFIENPIGADFDPEDLIRRFESGEPESELFKRPSVGPRGLDSVPEFKKPAMRNSYELVEAAS